jgi:hypothetical protein
MICDNKKIDATCKLNSVGTWQDIALYIQRIVVRTLTIPPIYLKNKISSHYLFKKFLVIRLDKKN